mgnify:CR=1 FL=1
MRFGAPLCTGCDVPRPLSFCQSPRPVLTAPFTCSSRSCFLFLSPFQLDFRLQLPLAVAFPAPRRPPALGPSHRSQIPATSRPYPTAAMVSAVASTSQQPQHAPPAPPTKQASTSSTSSQKSATSNGAKFKTAASSATTAPSAPVPAEPRRVRFSVGSKYSVSPTFSPRASPAPRTGARHSTRKLDVCWMKADPWQLVGATYTGSGRDWRRCDDPITLARAAPLTLVVLRRLWRCDRRV